MWNSGDGGGKFHHGFGFTGIIEIKFSLMETLQVEEIVSYIVRKISPLPSPMTYTK